jgi:SAM-dependent methyltransferase
MAQRSRFLAYSDVKYGGAMDTWLDDTELVVLRCRACGHLWYRDQPGEERLAAMYASSRSFLGITKVDRQPSSHMKRQMRRLRRLVPVRARPALLDYGSGFGRWARAAVLAGFDVTAFEPSVERGQEETTEFALTHSLASLEGCRFAAINVEQVLEHVPEPVSVLRTIRQLCAPDAVVRITVPNIQRPHEGAAIWKDWPFNGRAIHTMAPFEHLHGFTPGSLRSATERAGFRPIPWTRIAATHPRVVAHRCAFRFSKRLGQTFALVEPA